MKIESRSIGVILLQQNESKHWQSKDRGKTGVDDSLVDVICYTSLFNF